jgi:hypothetical protein
MHEDSRTERNKDRQRDKRKYMAKLIGDFGDSANKPKKKAKL